MTWSIGWRPLDAVAVTVIGSRRGAQQRHGCRSGLAAACRTAGRPPAVVAPEALGWLSYRLRRKAQLSPLALQPCLASHLARARSHILVSRVTVTPLGMRAG